MPPGPPDPPARPSVRVLTREAELHDAGLRRQWAALWSSSADASPYLTWEWVTAWWRHFGGRDRLHVAAAYRGDRLVALAPMLDAAFGPGRSGPRMLVGVGQETAGYGGWLLGPEPDRAADALLDHVDAWLARGRLRAVDLTRLRPEGDLLARVTARYGGGGGRVRLRRVLSEEYPRLDLRLVDDPERHVSRLWKRNDVRRRLRRLSEGHDVAFTYHRTVGDGGLDRFLALHDARWAEKGVPSGLFASGPGRRFVRDVSEALDAAGLLRLSFVEVDGRPVVGRYGFEAGGWYYGEKSGWDPGYAPYGPGHLAVGEIVAHMVGTDVEVFDFMRGAGEHKRPWANTGADVGYWTLADRAAPVWADRLLWTHLRLRAWRRSGRSLPGAVARRVRERRPRAAAGAGGPPPEPGAPGARDQDATNA